MLSLNPVTIILILLLVGVTILYLTKSSNKINFEEVVLPISSPDGNIKLEHISKEVPCDNTEKKINVSIPTFKSGDKTTIIFDLIDNGKLIFGNTESQIIGALFEKCEKNTNLQVKLFESYSNNVYQLHLLYDSVIFASSIIIPTTTRPKLGISNDSNFVISNLTYPQYSNEIKVPIVFPTTTTTS
jgi:hypothetical protein